MNNHPKTKESMAGIAKAYLLIKQDVNKSAPKTIALQNGLDILNINELRSIDPIPKTNH